MTGTPKTRITEREFVTRLRHLIDTGKIKAGTVYSAEEVAAIVDCSAVMVKRFMPVVAAMLEIRARVEWQKRDVGGNTRYTFIVGPTTPQKE